MDTHPNPKASPGREGRWKHPHGHGAVQPGHPLAPRGRAGNSVLPEGASGNSVVRTQEQRTPTRLTAFPLLP